MGSFLEFLHPNALLHPQPIPDLVVSLALEYGGFQVGQDGRQQVFEIFDFGPRRLAVGPAGSATFRCCSA
jgi:hypothetical protein